MKTTDRSHKAQTQGKSRAELDIGYEAYLSSLEADYRAIKLLDEFSECKKEIGYHAHMTKSRKREG